MPIQKAAIPIILAGRDLMACAQTGYPFFFNFFIFSGSGKTAAFLLPVISKLLYNGPPPSATLAYGSRQKSCPQALLLSPTRELALQIYKDTQQVFLKTHTH